MLRIGERAWHEAPALSHCETIGSCVVIPVFNHARTVGEVVRGSRAHAHTVLVCDDGSTDGSGAAAKAAGADLLTHPVNLGKGAALRTLLQEAARRGFRYVICLDADGQHYPKDIPSLVDAVKQQPGSIVIGARDLIAAGAPPSSEFGRKFSNFWIWLEGGQRVEDTQSGFRAYPLPETLALMGSRSRYDFEVDVLLRASWAGLSLRSTKIDVLYPNDRITHFKQFADNARISILNIVTIIRLFLPLPMAPLLHRRARRPGFSLDAIRRWFWLGGPGPIWRTVAAALAWFGGWGVLASAAIGTGAFPTLIAWWAFSALNEKGQFPQSAIIAAAFGIGLFESLFRKRAIARAELASARPWDGKSKSGAAGYLFFVVLFKALGRWPANAVLHLVAAWFLIFATAARRASLQFLDRAIGPAKGLKAVARTYRHLVAFAHTLVDRVELGVDGPKRFTRIAEKDAGEHLDSSVGANGSILLTAHLGSWELASGLLGSRLKTPFDIVAYDGEEPQVRAAIERSSEKFKPNILPVGKGELAALDILRALRAGHMVALQGDRTVDERTVEVDFLGHPAHFPVGPFVIAALSGAKVVPAFNIRIAPYKYEFFAFEPKTYAFDRSRSKNDQLTQWVQEYVRKVEQLVRKHPLQWFNFFDVWAKPIALNDAPRGSPP